MTTGFLRGFFSDSYRTNIGTIDDPIMVAPPRYFDGTVDPDDLCCMIEQATAVMLDLTE